MSDNTQLQPQWITLPTSSLKFAPWNYKTSNEATQKALTENIRLNGQVETILVREIGDGNFEVVNGNHRLQSFLDAEIPEVFVCNVGSIDDERAKLLAIQLNETRFAGSRTAMSKLLNDIQDSQWGDLYKQTLPYSPSEIENMLRLAAPMEIPSNLDFGKILEEVQAQYGPQNENEAASGAHVNKGGMTSYGGGQKNTLDEAERSPESVFYLEIEIPKSLYERLNPYAAQNNMTVSEAIVHIAESALGN